VEHAGSEKYDSIQAHGAIMPHFLGNPIAVALFEVVFRGTMQSE